MSFLNPAEGMSEEEKDVWSDLSRIINAVTLTHAQLNKKPDEMDYWKGLTHYIEMQPLERKYLLIGAMTIILKTDLRPMKVA